MFRVPLDPDNPTMKETEKISFSRWLKSNKAERKEWMRRRNEVLRKRMEKLPIRHFDNIALKRDSIGRGLVESHPLAGVTAAVEAGVQSSQRTTATRVIGGALLAGPAGAVVGGVAKKKVPGKHYLVIAGPAFEWQIELDDKKLGKARQFAALVNTTAKQLDQ